MIETLTRIRPEQTSVRRKRLFGQRQSVQITYEDYRQFPDNGERYQIIDGELFMSPSPKIAHQDISGNIFSALHVYMEENPIGKVYEAPCDVVLSETDVVIPDIFVVLNENIHIITEDNVMGAPDFIIEILSPSNRAIDLKKKRVLYEKSGVKEYWIIDPDMETIQKLVLKNRQFVEAELFDNEKQKKISSTIVKGFSLEGKKIFKR